MDIIRNGVFTLAWSASPKARQGLVKGDPELRVRDISFPGTERGDRCFGRVVSSNSVELCFATSLEKLKAHGASPTLQVDLDAGA
jgi:hypothetical protein